MAKTDPLLTPFKLKHLNLKNRIFSTAHAPGYVEDAMPQERYQLYHEEKAKGGLSMTMFGGSSNIDLDSPSAFGQIDIGHDRIIPYLHEFGERIHAHNCAIMCQITHMGRRTVWNAGDWLPIIGPSSVREPQHRGFPREMELSDIKRVIKAYGQAARRIKEGGLDGVEILGTGHLIDQFWTPSVNQRTDAYGGSLENRMRFGIEVLEEVRRVVGDDFIVGIRMTGDEILDDGLSAEDCLEIAVYYTGTGMLDYVSVVGSHVATDAALARMITGMGSPSGPYLELARNFKQAVSVPVFQASRIADLSTARHAISEGILDMVAMTRAHMADPHIVNKLMAGEEERIRPCVGAGYCIDRIYEAGAALCIHNPATGREKTMPHVIDKGPGPKKRVVVVGGGPAGLEAARVSALRGHEVVLFEATDRLGGQVNLAAVAPTRKEIIGITDWLAPEAERHGVDIRINTYAEAADVEAEDPDIVVIATGGVPNATFLKEGEDLVSTVWDVLGGFTVPRGDILLYDDNGQHQGPSCAAYIAEYEDARLSFVTPDRMAAFEMGATNHPRYMTMFYDKEIPITTDHRLMAVRREGNRLAAEFKNEFTNKLSAKVFDQIVVEHGTTPADGLYFDLKPGSSNDGELDQHALVEGRAQQIVRNKDGRYQLFRVGDVAASRNIHAAIYDSLRLCKTF